MPDRVAVEALGARIVRRMDDGEPAPVIAMQLLMEAETREAALAALDYAASDLNASRPVQPVAELIARNPAAWDTVRTVIGSVEHAPAHGDAIAHWARSFDRLVGISPEGSVALYSLGDPQLLAEATAEIVARLDDWGLLDPPPDVLDIGCGIGRLETALASRAGSITGLDISAAMVDEARRRCGHLRNVRIARSTGSDLRGIADESFDLVTLIDTLPYVVLSGAALVERLLGEAARVLRPGGSVVVLCVSYRGDPDADLADLARLAAAAGLHFSRADWRPFRLWDAPAFELVKRPPPPESRR